MLLNVKKYSIMLVKTQFYFKLDNNLDIDDGLSKMKKIIHRLNDAYHKKVRAYRPQNVKFLLVKIHPSIFDLEDLTRVLMFN